MDKWAVLSGGLALSSVAFSLYEITMHMSNFTKPYLQRYIIRILFMVPIYSLNAWFAMIYPPSGLYLDSMREVYESYVIYSFMKYLMNFLNYETNLQRYIDDKPGPSHIVPLCCLPNCIGGRKFLSRCKEGILQYVIIRPITTALAFISQQLDLYGEGNYNPLSGYTYPILFLINNASQATAMYCLVIFYTGYKHELQPMRPVPKFFSIKLVIFFSFFQSVAVAILIKIELVHSIIQNMFPNVTNPIALGRKIQEALICFDMLVASFGHLYAFNYRPFVRPDSGRPREGAESNTAQPSNRLHHQEHLEQSDQFNPGPRGFFGALFHILDFSEDKSDLSEHFSRVYARFLYILRFGNYLPVIVPSSGSGGATGLCDDQNQQPSDQYHAGVLDRTASENGDHDSAWRRLRDETSAIRGYKSI